MKVVAPEIIERYFRTVGEDDLDGLIACFSEDAVVIDEGRTYRGPDQIRGWRERTRAAYRYTAEMLAFEQDDDRVVVTARLVGDFPGSPLEIPYVFTLRAGLIGNLHIDP
jgi:ketosteroid isomerase-like protein